VLGHVCNPEDEKIAKEPWMFPQSRREEKIVREKGDSFLGEPYVGRNGLKKGRGEDEQTDRRNN